MPMPVGVARMSMQGAVVTQSRRGPRRRGILLLLPSPLDPAGARLATARVADGPERGGSHDLRADLKYLSQK